MDINKYCEILDSSSEKVLQLARSCSSKQLGFKPEGKWGILEILEHIWLTDKIIHYLISKPTDKVSQSSEIIGDTKLKRFVADGRTKKIEAPDVVKPKGNLPDIETFEELFLKHRERLKKDLKTGQIVVDNRMIKHFYMGEMTISDWLNLIVHHTHRHLKQINEVITDMEERT